MPDRLEAKYFEFAVQIFPPPPSIGASRGGGKKMYALLAIFGPPPLHFILYMPLKNPIYFIVCRTFGPVNFRFYYNPSPFAQSHKFSKNLSNHSLGCLER